MYGRHGSVAACGAALRTGAVSTVVFDQNQAAGNKAHAGQVAARLMQDDRTAG